MTTRKAFSISDNLKAAYTAIQKAYTTYDKVLDHLSGKGVDFKSITATIIADEFGEVWPTKENKEGVVSFVGIKKAIEEGCEEAVWLNRFNVYRNRFEGYETLKVSTTGPKLPTVGKSRNEAEKTKGDGADNKTSSVKTMDKEDVDMLLRKAYTILKLNAAKADKDTKEDHLMLVSLFEDLYIN